MSLAPWLLVAMPGIALAMTLVNALTWRRGRTGARFEGKVSALIPARNEAERLPECIRSIAASGRPVDEIVVYDDDSTDATASVLADLSRELPMLRVIRGSGLPAGWVGKPHACHRLAEEARGDILLFLDADVRLEPDGIERLASLFHDARADVVTAAPRQITGSIIERLVVPLLLLSYVSWLPLELVARSASPSIVAANGQILAVKREALAVMGGFRAVAQEIVDDVAFCRRAKERGLTVAFADGSRIASCRMYRSARAVCEGFSKNIHEGVGGALAIVIAVYLAAFVVPYVALAVAAFGSPDLLAPASVAVAANLAQRALMAARWRQPLAGVLTHPLGVLAVISIALNSFWWSLRGEIVWAGRRYAGRASRKEAS